MLFVLCICTIKMHEYPQVNLNLFLPQTMLICLDAKLSIFICSRSLLSNYCMVITGQVLEQLFEKIAHGCSHYKYIFLQLNCMHRSLHVTTQFA